MSTLFQLSMAGADGTSIDTLTPSVGSAMVAFATVTPVITSDRARRRVASSGNNARTNQTLSTADYAAELSLRRVAAAANDIIRLYCRAVDTNNAYLVSWFGGTWTLRKTVAASPTNYGTYSQTPSDGADFTARLEVEQNGSNVDLRFYLNGVLHISGTDTGNSFPGANNAGFSIESTAGNDPITTGFHVNSMLVEDFAAPSIGAPPSLVDGDIITSLVNGGLVR